MCHTNKTASIILFLSILVLVSGGESFCGWEIQKPAGDTNLNDIAFIDELHGWAVGDSSLILATVDGGETWIEQESPVAGMNWDMVYPVTADKVFCVDHTSHDIDVDPSTGTILVTDNGGVDWTVLDTNVPRISPFFNISFIDTTNGWVSYRPNVAGEYCQVWRTSDGGNTWEKLSDVTSLAEPIHSIQFINENNGWFSSGSDIDTMSALDIYHTADGGKTWELLYNFENRAAQGTIWVAPPDTLWCCSYSPKYWLYRSCDGGRLWDEMALDRSEGWKFLLFHTFTGMYAGNKGYSFLYKNIDGEYPFIEIDFNTREIVYLDTAPSRPNIVTVAGNIFWMSTYNTNEI